MAVPVAQVDGCSWPNSDESQTSAYARAVERRSADRLGFSSCNHTSASSAKPTPPPKKPIPTLLRSRILPHIRAPGAACGRQTCSGAETASRDSPNLCVRAPGGRVFSFYWLHQPKRRHLPKFGKLMQPTKKLLTPLLPASPVVVPAVLGPRRDGSTVNRLLGKTGTTRRVCPKAVAGRWSTAFYLHAALLRPVSSPAKPRARQGGGW